MFPPYRELPFGARQRAVLANITSEQRAELPRDSKPLRQPPLPGIALSGRHSRQ